MCINTLYSVILHIWGIFFCCYQFYFNAVFISLLCIKPFISPSQYFPPFPNFRNYLFLMVQFIYCYCRNVRVLAFQIPLGSLPNIYHFQQCLGDLSFLKQLNFQYRCCLSSAMYNLNVSSTTGFWISSQCQLSVVHF